jgi:long-chain acyl-CoA synthetase
LTARPTGPSTKVVVPGDNLPEMFWNAVAKRGERTLFRQKKYGLWQSLSWNEVAAIVREAGMGLLELGFEVGETTSILGNTRQEWLFSDLAVLSCGGISSGIYPTDAASQVEYLMQDSNSVIIFVEDDEQLDKALEVRERLPALRKIVVWDMGGLRDLHDEQVISFEQLRELGRTRLAKSSVPMRPPPNGRPASFHAGRKTSRS